MASTPVKAEQPDEKARNKTETPTNENLMLLIRRREGEDFNVGEYDVKYEPNILTQQNIPKIDPR